MDDFLHQKINRSDCLLRANVSDDHILTIVGHLQLTKHFRYIPLAQTRLLSPTRRHRLTHVSWFTASNRNKSITGHRILLRTTSTFDEALKGTNKKKASPSMSRFPINHHQRLSTLHRHPASPISIYRRWSPTMFLFCKTKKIISKWFSYVCPFSIFSPSGSNLDTLASTSRPFSLNVTAQLKGEFTLIATNNGEVLSNYILHTYSYGFYLDDTLKKRSKSRSVIAWDSPWFGSVFPLVVQFNIVTYGSVRYHHSWFGLVLAIVVRFGIMNRGSIWNHQRQFCSVSMNRCTSLANVDPIH